MNNLSSRVGRRPKITAETITMAHGSGGKAMKDLIEDVFVGSFDNEELSKLEDQARIDLAAIAAAGDRLALTTDSYVVFPLFFPGGDIGKLAIAGTVNDLAVGGATPLYLTCSMIIEEGFPVEDLRKVVRSMYETAREAGVSIVTGDTKVVERGSADKLFINTAGVGVIARGVQISASAARAGDVVLINGTVGDHGAAIVASRGELAIESDVKSDCQPLNKLIAAMLAVCPEIHCLRDATRGGVATVLNEFATASGVAIKLTESAIPIRDDVRGTCEILGLDPLYLANEGKVVVVAPAKYAEALLAAMRSVSGGERASLIGEVFESASPAVTVRTTFGGEKMVDMLVGDQLPRIC